MKKLEIIIPERCLPDVSDIIKEARATGYSFYSIVGKGDVPEFHTKVKVEVVVRDEQVDEIIKKAIDRIGGDIKTGGKIFVSDVATAVDLVTKKKGESAI